MKSIFFFLALIGFAGMSFALAPGDRCISNIPGASESLLRIVSPKFYQTLLLRPSKDGLSPEAGGQESSRGVKDHPL